MKHPGAALEAQLSAMLDGELSAEEAAAVEGHLSSCAQCRGVLAELRGARELLEAMPPVAPPPDLLAAIKRDAATEMARGESVVSVFWLRWRAPVAGLAAAAAVMLAVLAPWQSGDRGSDPAVCIVPGHQPLVAEQAQPVAGDIAATESETIIAEVTRAPEAGAAMSGVSRGSRAARPSARGRRVVREEAAAGEAETSAPVSAEVEPVLAFAPQNAERASARAAGPVFAEARPVMVASRTTIDEDAELEPVGPSPVEAELATGIVARMVLDKYIGEHLVQSSSNMLAVVTETPSAELGTMLADDDDASFGLCFTDAMRRALTETENRLP